MSARPSARPPRRAGPQGPARSLPAQGRVMPPGVAGASTPTHAPDPPRAAARLCGREPGGRARRAAFQPGADDFPASDFFFGGVPARGGDTDAYHFPPPQSMSRRVTAPDDLDQSTASVIGSLCRKGVGGATQMVKTAGDVMSSPAICIPAAASVAEIAALMSSKHISAVVVSDTGGKMLGLVSEGDLLRPFRESAKLRRDWWLGLLAAGEELSQAFLDYIRVDNRTAKDVMVTHVITADEDATLPHLAELMMQHGIKR